MHKRAFQGLKRTFMHVSGLPPPYFDNKTKYYSKFWLREIWKKNKNLSAGTFSANCTIDALQNFDIWFYMINEFIPFMIFVNRN